MKILLAKNIFELNNMYMFYFNELFMEFNVDYTWHGS